MIRPSIRPVFRPMIRPVIGTLVAAIALGAAVTLPAIAAEDALYDAAPPADAVFVRLMAPERIAPMIAPVTVSFGGRELVLEPADGSAYVALSAGGLENVPAGGFYSVALMADGAARLIEEPARDGATKVHLVLLNLGDAPVRLVVAEAGAEVVSAVAAQAAGSRAVNPVQATLAVERVADGVELGRFDVALRRGQNLTFVAGDTSARLVENAFGPVLSLD